MNFVYSELPVKVASRIVSNKEHKAINIFRMSRSKKMTKIILQ